MNHSNVSKPPCGNASGYHYRNRKCNGLISTVGVWIAGQSATITSGLADAPAIALKSAQAATRTTSLGEGSMSWKPSLWASVIPRNPMERKPNQYWEILRAAWENRDQLPFAWRILNHGVCDGCALGTTGLKDWTTDGVHLCMVRLELMSLNTSPALNPNHLADVHSPECTGSLMDSKPDATFEVGL